MSEAERIVPWRGPRAGVVARMRHAGLQTKGDGGGVFSIGRRPP